MQRVVPGGWCVMVYSPFCWTFARPSLDLPSVLGKNVYVRDTFARFLCSSFVFVRHVLFILCHVCNSRVLLLKKCSIIWHDLRSKDVPL